jgi:hypothetical protein
MHCPLQVKDVSFHGFLENVWRISFSKNNLESKEIRYPNLCSLNRKEWKEMYSCKTWKDLRWQNLKIYPDAPIVSSLELVTVSILMLLNITRWANSMLLFEAWSEFTIFMLIVGGCWGSVRLYKCCALNCIWSTQKNKQTNSMVWVRERTLPTERPPLVGEVIASFCE